VIPFLHIPFHSIRAVPGSFSQRELDERLMKTLLFLVGWCLLFVLCWPVALLALVLWPFVWLVSLPFRLIGITFEALFALLRAVLFLPARLFGYRPASAGRSSL